MKKLDEKRSERGCIGLEGEAADECLRVNSKYEVDVKKMKLETKYSMLTMGAVKDAALERQPLR